MGVGKVLPYEVRSSLQRILIRLELGRFLNSGPRANIISVESLVAYSTAVNELYREGYQMVPAEAYAATYRISLASVYQKIHLDGSLVALFTRRVNRPKRQSRWKRRRSRTSMVHSFPGKEIRTASVSMLLRSLANWL